MSKQRKKVDKRQLNLFDALKNCPAADKNSMGEGSLNVQAQLRRSLIQAIKNCSLSRHQVSGEMSHLLGHEVNKTTLDSWTAESKERNRIPAEYLPAFCKVTGDREPLRLIAEAGDMYAMPGPEALRAEIQKYDEEERKARAEKRKRLKFLEEMEGH